MDKLHNGFHFSYVHYSKKNQIKPNLKIKTRNRFGLEFFADRITFREWKPIAEALENDCSLKKIAIKLEKTYDYVIENANTEKKAKKIDNQPVILTKFVFKRFLNAISSSLQVNSKIEELNLEGFPLNGKYISYLAKGLERNNSIKRISFSRSFIDEESCQIICSTIKYLRNVERLDLSRCGLTTRCAEIIANLIKHEKIIRYSESWEHSLRYRDVKPEQCSGLNTLILNNNPKIGDDGLLLIVDVLKDDSWINEIEMDNCGFTETGYKEIEDCLTVNKTLKKFSSLSLPKISEDNSITENIRLTIKKLEADMNEKMQYLEEKLASELYQKRQSEHLAEQLHRQLIEAKKQISIQEKNQIREGYMIVKEADYEKFLKEQAAAIERQRKLEKRVTKTKPNSKKRQFFEKNIGDTHLTGRIQEEAEEESFFLEETMRSKNTEYISFFLEETMRSKNTEYIKENDGYDSTSFLDESQSNFRVSMKPKLKSNRNHHLSAQNLFMGTSMNDSDSDTDSS